MDNNILAFFELVRAGLWAKEARLSQFNNINYANILQLAEEQSVVGLVTAGLEHIDVRGQKEDVRCRPSQDMMLQFVGETLQIEQQNKDMNAYLARLIERLRKEDVYAVLVKGQGTAQCYEKPLWRSSGDIDLLLSDTNYEKAKQTLMPLAVSVDKEYTSFKHLGMTMEGGFVVELHGTMHSRLSKRVDNVVDIAQRDIFFGGNVRSWQNGSTTVFLPAPNHDVIFVFTHILHHYYIEGIGLRQISDWCRLLYTYKESLNHGLLESRIKKAGLMSEWKAFAALAVNWLGMPAESMPLYSPEKKWSRKAERIVEFVLECGNFGHNRQAAAGKISSAWYKMQDFARHSCVFPRDSVKFFFHFLGDGIKLV